jgi:hypothetical protein
MSGACRNRAVLVHFYFPWRSAAEFFASEVHGQQ